MNSPYIRILCFVALFSLVWHAEAQRPRHAQAESVSRVILEARISKLRDELLIDDATAEAWLERHEALLEHPLEVNSSTLESLMSIPLISEYQAYQIIHYRTEQGGRIASVYDLKSVDGWDEETLRYALPLLYVEVDMPHAERSSLGQLVRDGHATATILIQNPLEGKADPSYVGSPEAVALRWHWQSHDRLSVYVGADKDSYEPWAYRSHWGFDSYSGHIALRRWGIVRQVVVGDFRTSWGEGLTISQGYRLRGLSQISSSSFVGIRPSSGLSEMFVNRGAALDLDLTRRLRLSAIASWRRLDGAVGEDGTVTSLSEGGLHRTARDWDRRRALPTTLLGVRLGYEGRQVQIALQGIRYSWGGYTLAHATGASYNARLDDLKSHANLSLSHRYADRRGALRLSGEVALSSLGAFAWVERLSYRASSGAELTIGVRAIGSDYWTYHGQTYSHHLRPSNEQGIGLSYLLPRLIRRLDVRVEGDLYRSMMPRRGDANSSGGNLRAELRYRLPEDLGLWLRTTYRWERGKSSSLRLSLTAERSEQSYDMRLMISTARMAEDRGDWGWAIGLRAGYRPSDRLRLWLSGVYHQVDDWAERIYWSEPRLSQQYGSTFLYRRGVRGSLGIAWRATKRLELGLRAVHHRYTASHPSSSHIALQLKLR